MILTVMIAPIMIAIIVDALRAVPRAWTEGAAALGVNRWRTMWTVSVRAARPAIVAGAVLACARALGEAIMLSMVSGSRASRPTPSTASPSSSSRSARSRRRSSRTSESLNAPGGAARASTPSRCCCCSRACLLSIGGYAGQAADAPYGMRV